jgi:hypothetical protein
MNAQHKTGSLVAVILVVGACLAIAWSGSMPGDKTILTIIASTAIIAWLFMHGGEAPDGKDFSQDDKG